MLIFPTTCLNIELYFYQAVMVKKERLSVSELGKYWAIVAILIIILVAALTYQVYKRHSVLPEHEFATAGTVLVSPHYQDQ